MTSANPLLQNCTAHEKSREWPFCSTKSSSDMLNGTPQNMPNKTFYQQSEPFTMTILDSPATPKTHSKLPKLKLEMEMFSDLSTYCQQAIPTTVHSLNMQPSQGELNTPIFEPRAPLDFDRRQTAGSDKDAIILDDQSSLKIKSELNLENYVYINSEDIFPVRDRSFTSSLDSSSGKGSDDSIVIDSPDADSYVSVLSPEEVGYCYYTKSTTPAPVKNEILSRPNSRDTTEDYEFNGGATNSLSNTDELITDTELSDARVNFPTPESSREPTPALKLDVGQKFNDVDSLQTPDIIDTLESFDCEKDFNILNFINDEDIKVAGDLFPYIQDVTTVNESPPQLPDRPQPIYSGLRPEETHTYALPPQELQSHKRIPRKRRVKREDDDDDDEDYVPPSKRTYKPRGKASSSQKRMLLDIEINKHIYEELSKTTRRGRPPKSRVSSISSDSSEFLDSEEARYREMRDKNNEASRRSRFKRKLKERAVENEAEELADRNVKLVAQVEELERTVTTFRNNLMKLLLSKK